MSPHRRVTLALAAALGASTLLMGCSSSATPTGSPASDSTPATAAADASVSADATADASASADASAAAEASAAPTPSLDIPEDVLTAFLEASCVAPTAKGGGGGTWDAAALACTTPDGAVTKTDAARQALTNVNTRAMFIYSAYTKKIASALPDCPTLAQLEAARNSAAPATSDACIAEALTAVTAFLSKN